MFLAGGPGGDVLHGVMHGRTILYTIENRVIEYELSSKTFEELRTFMLKIFDVFSSALSVDKQ